ncbi:MAG: low temperature requirement protein A [Planctomycetota bacterium]
MRPAASSHRASKDKAASFIELFFDLVFVFSVTQVVGLLHGHITAQLVGQAVLVFWLVWWAWTQFTWALNAADATHTYIELAVLVATGVTFFMAVALPGAFSESALGFALAYTAVRAIGLGVYSWVAWVDDGQRSAVCRFTGASLLGLCAVLAGGMLGGAAQYWCWGLAVALDVLAALIGGRAEGWNLFPEHFVERHGLFVIIALGESMIVAANGVARGGWDNDVLVVASLAVATTCALWWTYFVRAKPALAHAMEHRQFAAQSTFARDAFSLMHFPMLLGVIAFAVAIEHMLAHPQAALHLETTAALALGVALFLGGMALALRRGTGAWPKARVALCLLSAAAILGLTGRPPVAALCAALVGTLALCVVEQRVPYRSAPRA